VVGYPELSVIRLLYFG